jgi:hypothetical protein
MGTVGHLDRSRLGPLQLPGEAAPELRPVRSAAGGPRSVELDRRAFARS